MSTSLTHDTRVLALLDGLDLVLNSNTLLLATQVDATSSVDNLCEQLTVWLHSSDFHNKMLAQDIERNWYNYHFFAPELTPRAGHFAPASARISGEVISHQHAVEYLRYLRDLLTNPRSPYQKQMTSTQADQIAQSAWAALAPNTATMALRVRPDFLFARSWPDLENDAAPTTPTVADPLYYFDGFGLDSALIIVAGPTTLLLLTNGMP